VRLAIVQMNATVGAIAANAEEIRAGMAAARRAHADLVLFPELALTGYPPEDLLLREGFLADARRALEELAPAARGLAAVVGFPERGHHVYNSAALLAHGSIQAIYRKVHLPNYGVFDERRYFQPGAEGLVVEMAGQRIGLTICEDIWEPGPPASAEAGAAATLIVNISASPYHAGKGSEREQMLSQRARDNLACVAFCNLVGGQDELVFDGHSCAFDHTGSTVARGAQFVEDFLVCDLDLADAAAARLTQAVRRPAAVVESGVRILPLLEYEDAAAPIANGHAAREELPEPSEELWVPIVPLEAEIYAALMLGLRDYVDKNGFEAVVLGVSGGIDSALVVCLAVDALGPERVNTAIMPSPYSSPDTRRDARLLAEGLGVHIHELPIQPIMEAYAETLSSDFAGLEPDITEENIQARIRGNLLMALSNKFGWLVLATGNKSEMSVGYSTLYGDLAGGLAVIKDVPKTVVYQLVRWRNSADAAAHGLSPSGGEPIPRTIIERAPTAELRHDQSDQDSLPPYPILDRIIQGYVELDRGRDQLVADGLPETDVDHTLRLIDLAEYKRRQAPPGIKISTRAFGRDRRMPITNRYRD
jgi:NAD+ synthase (glutamine-hydrolysing)